MLDHRFGSVAFISVLAIALGTVADADQMSKRPGDGETCNASYPGGAFIGFATSKQAGHLPVTLRLTCAGGRYNGSLVTSVAGTFSITRATFDGTKLKLEFSTNGAAGTIVATVDEARIDGTFTLGTDRGAVSLQKTSAPQPPSIPTLRLTPEQWHRDLMDLANQLPAAHPDAFRFTTRADFAHDVSQLDRNLPRMNGDQTYFALDGIATSIGDAHTYISFPPDDANLPIDIALFGRDYRVTSADSTNAVAIGARVLAIEGVPIEAARKRLLSITPAPETMLLREGHVEAFMTIGMLLHGSDISARRDVVRYMLQSDDGKRFLDVVRAVSPHERTNYAYAWHKRPLWQARPQIGFWYVYLPSTRTVYCSFRSYVGLAHHATALLRFVQHARPSKLVVDMRSNGGGDYHDGLNDLILPIRSLSWINRRGHLFVLVDRDTFSAAMGNAAQFREYTHALLAGEVIGERPNSYQEPRDFLLPNSGLVVRYSTKFYMFVHSGANEVVPDKVIVPTWVQFKGGKDPVLAWALAYRR